MSWNEVLKKINLGILLFHFFFTQVYSQQMLSIFDFKRNMKKSILICSDVFQIFNSFVMWSAYETEIIFYSSLHNCLNIWPWYSSS